MDRVGLAIEHATGRRGPLRGAFELLRRVGIGERMLKTAAGAFIAWEAGTLIPGNGRPYLAPLTVILVMQATIAQSVAFAIQRALGVAIGVVVAIAMVETVGVHGWSIGVVTLVSLAVGARLRISAQGTAQVAVTALIVMLLGSSGSLLHYSGLRIADTLLGTAVALGMNALFAPPSVVPQARRAIAALGAEAAAVLDDVAAGVGADIAVDRAERNLERARAIAKLVDRAEAALDQAQTSLKYHPFARGERSELAAALRAGRALERTSIQVRVIARAARDGAAAPEPRWIAPERVGRRLADLLTATSAAVRAFVALNDGTGDFATFDLALGDVEHARDRAGAAARVTLTGSLPDDWVLTGEIVAVAGRLIADLAEAATAADAAGLPDPV